MKENGLVSAYTKAAFRPHSAKVNETDVPNVVGRRFDGEPTDEQLVDYALSLEDRLNAVCAATGVRLYQDVRGRWLAAEQPKGHAPCRRDVQFQELKLRLNDCIWELVGKTSEEELEERDVPDCVMRTLDFMSRGVSIWQGTMSNLMDAAEIADVTVPVMGKHLAQHSGFMLSRGVRYSKRHTSTGQLVTLERVQNEGSEGSEGKLAI